MFKKFVYALIATVSLLCLACCPPHIGAPQTVSNQILTSTIALVLPGSPPTVFCSAVWIGPKLIVTVNHCIAGAAREQEIPIDLVVIHFQLLGDKKTVYDANVITRIPSHDLALLEYIGNNIITHPYVELADKITIGEPIAIVGHPAKLMWTYMVGVVAQVREAYSDFDVEDDDKELLRPPFIQVSAPIWFGNSGGGAFNARGELIGIASFLMKVPNTGFFIPASEIRAMLVGQYLRKARI